MSQAFMGMPENTVSRVMNREKLSQLEENFWTAVAPLLDENDTEDYHFIWEFQKFFHAKKLQVLTAEKQGVKKWKELLLSR
jgi:hypothetical protein